MRYWIFILLTSIAAHSFETMPSFQEDLQELNKVASLELRRNFQANMAYIFVLAFPELQGQEQQIILDERFGIGEDHVPILRSIYFHENNELDTDRLALLVEPFKLPLLDFLKFAQTDETHLDFLASFIAKQLYRRIKEYYYRRAPYLTEHYRSKLNGAVLKTIEDLEHMAFDPIFP